MCLGIGNVNAKRLVRRPNLTVLVFQERGKGRIGSNIVVCTAINAESKRFHNRRRSSCSVTARSYVGEETEPNTCKFKVLVQVGKVRITRKIIEFKLEDSIPKRQIGRIVSDIIVVLFYPRSVCEVVRVTFTSSFEGVNLTLSVAVS